jgi:hypothetical protein
MRKYPISHQFAKKKFGGGGEVISATPILVFSFLYAPFSSFSAQSFHFHPLYLQSDKSPSEFTRQRRPCIIWRQCTESVLGSALSACCTGLRCVCAGRHMKL